MIIKEENNKQEERNKIKIIFKLLKDIQLPYPYIFKEDCVEIRYYKLYGLINRKIAEINLMDDYLEATFEEEEDLDYLRDYFKYSNTKFILKVKDFYY